MKSTLLVLIFNIAAVSAQAQWILGGNFSLSSSKSEYEAGINNSNISLVSISALPRLAYQVKNNQWIGLETGLISIYSDRPNFGSNNTEERTRLFSVSPFYRYVFKPSEIFGIWIEAQAGAGFGASWNNGEKDDSYVTSSAGLRPGILFFINKHLSFEASFGNLGFSSITVKDAQGSNDRQRFSELGFSLNSVNNAVNAILLDAPSSLGSFQFGVNWTFSAGKAK
ncbi:MAG TPA: hypothetical protein DCF33_15325 [Saprospirales bacterium]|nr:hypothetical protein [Saprospirales bacterium]